MSILGTAAKLGGPALSGGLSFLGGIKTYLIVAGLAGAIAFGGGYYLAVSQAEKNAATQPARAAKAQKKQDEKSHSSATTVSRAVKKDHDSRAQHTASVISSIDQPSYKSVDPKNCWKTPESIHALNEAGR